MTLPAVAPDDAASAADATALAGLRIGTAAVLLFQATAGGRDLLHFVAPRGIVQRPIADVLVHWSLPRLDGLYGPAARLGITDAQLIFSLLGVHLLALALLLIGWRTRATALVSWLSYLTLKASGASSAYGAYEVGNIALFYCTVLPVGLALSVDRLDGRQNSRWLPYLAPCRWLLRAHLSIAYLASGIAKASGPQWGNGEALWRAVMRPVLAWIDLSWLAWVPVLPLLVGLSVLALELCYPLFAWIPRTRGALLVAIVAMHAGIAVVLGLWSFSGLMIVLNWAALAQGDGWAAARYRTARSTARRSSRGDASLS